MTNRLFISLELPKNIVKSLIEKRNSLVEKPGMVKWEHESKLHITIKFLGDVGENTAALIDKQLKNIKFGEFQCQFSKYGFFTKNKIPKILYANFVENEDIEIFKNIIENEMELCGFTKEKRKFIPHVTLMRLKNEDDYLKVQNFNEIKIDIEPFVINEFSLLKSELLPNGSRYTKLKEYKLI